MTTLTNIDPTFASDISNSINGLAFQADGTVLHSLLTANSYREIAYPSLVTTATHSMSPQAGVITVDGTGLIYWMPQSPGLSDVDIYVGLPGTLLTAIAYDEVSGYSITYDLNNDLLYVLVTGILTPTPSPARLVRVTTGGTQTDIIPDGVLPAMDDTGQAVVTPDGAVWGATGTGGSRTAFRWDPGSSTYATTVLTNPRPRTVLIPRPDNTVWFVNVVDNLGWQLDSSLNLSRVALLDTIGWSDIRGVAWTPDASVVVFVDDFYWELRETPGGLRVGMLRMRPT